jgi:Glycosyl hydrolases family 43
MLNSRMMKQMALISGTPGGLLVLLAVVALLVSNVIAQPNVQLPPTCYLFSSFRDNGQDGLHLSWSTDGLQWTALNGDRTFLRPQVGKEKLMRDPCVLQGPGGIFHMVWTDSWSDRTIGYAHSTDLIHWSPQIAIPVMKDEPTARNCWAPEVVYDESKKQFIIFWATTIPRRFPQTDSSSETDYNHRIYCTTTADFKNFTPTKLFYDGGFNVIDATMLRANGKFYLIVKDETLKPIAKKNLRMAVSDKIDGPFTHVTDPFTESWVEGPTALTIGDDFFVFYDCYTRHRYGAVQSTDLQHWKDISAKIEFPPGSRHGTVLAVSSDVIRPLLALSGKSK